MLENQMDVRKKEIEELQSQARALSQEGKSTDEVDGKRLTVEKKFLELLEPLNERKANLLASKEIHQFNRDVEDEIVSTKEILFPDNRKMSHLLQSYHRKKAFDHVSQ